MRPKLEFTIIFPSDIKVASVNSQYEPKRASGGKIIGFYLNPAVNRMKAFIQKSLKDQGYDKRQITNDWGLLKCTYVYIFKENIFKRDVDNGIKSTQDAIFQYFGRNDSTILEVHAYKFLNPSAEFESMKCVIESLGSDSSLYNLDVQAKLNAIEAQKG